MDRSFTEPTSLTRAAGLARLEYPGGEPGDGSAPDDAAVIGADATSGDPAATGGLAGPGALRQDRIDAASLEERGHPKEAWLVFHEAKD